MSQSIMDSLKAENLLKDSEILKMIERLKTGLRYKTDDTYVSFDDHFITLQAQVDGIKRIQLADNVVPALGAVYENELLSHLEEIQDQVERISILIIRFQGEIARADADTKETAVAFEAWYSIAAKEFLAGTSIKLPEATIKSLGKTEFTRLMSQSNLGLSSLSEALKILLRQLDGKKKLAQAKLQLGRDQINAAHFNRLPETMGVNPERPRFNLIVDEDEVTPEPTTPFVAPPPLPKFVDEEEVTLKQPERQPVVVKSTPAETCPVSVPFIYPVSESLIAIDAILQEEETYTAEAVAELSKPPEEPEPQVITETIVVIPDVHNKEVADALEVLEVLKNIPTISTNLMETLATPVVAAAVPTPTRRRSILDDLEEVPVSTQGTVKGFTAAEAAVTPTAPKPAPVATASKPTSKLVFLDEE